MKMLCKVIEVLPQRQFTNQSGEEVVTRPIVLTQGADVFVGEVMGLQIAALPEGLGANEMIWCDLSFAIREFKTKEGERLFAQKVSIRNVVRF